MSHDLVLAQPVDIFIEHLEDVVTVSKIEISAATVLAISVDHLDVQAVLVALGLDAQIRVVFPAMAFKQFIHNGYSGAASTISRILCHRRQRTSEIASIIS